MTIIALLVIIAIQLAIIGSHQAPRQQCQSQSRTTTLSHGSSETETVTECRNVTP